MNSSPVCGSRTWAKTHTYVVSQFFTEKIQALVIAPLVLSDSAQQKRSGLLRAYWDHTALPAHHTYIPARTQQDLEHYIRNELLNGAAHFTDPERMEA